MFMRSTTGEMNAYEMYAHETYCETSKVLPKFRMQLISIVYLAI
jgi:hypothetical protein